MAPLRSDAPAWAGSSAPKPGLTRRNEVSRSPHDTVRGKSCRPGSRQSGSNRERSLALASPMKIAHLKAAGALYLGSLVVIYALVLWNARDLIWKGYPDFTIYYTAGTMIRQGMGHTLYDDAAQFKIQQQFAPNVATRLAALPFNHPPFEALIFIPLTYLSYRVAFLLWALLNVALIFTAMSLIRPYAPLLREWPAALIGLASLAFFPIFFALLQGQDAILLLFFYALTFVALKNNSFFSAGAWLACGLFKFHLVLPFLLLMLVLQKTAQARRKIFCGFLLVGAVLGLVSLAMVGMQQMIFYPRYVLGLEATMARGAIMPSDMPNLRGALYLIASKLPHFDLAVVALSGVVFALALCKLRSREERTDDLKYSLAIITTVLVSYHGLGYDLCLLVIPIVLVGGWLKTRMQFVSWSRTAIIAGLALLLFPPLHLVLLMRYNRLGFLGWAVLLFFAGVCGELGSRSLRPAADLAQD